MTVVIRYGSMQETPNLTRLGHLLIDLNALCAVLPLQGDTPADCHGFNIVTNGGVLQVYDSETAEAVRQHFYEGATCASAP
jgi:hypothetical protein